MKIFTCLLCKKSNLGKDKPTHCPFCGAISRHLVHPKDFYEDESFIQPNTAKFLQEMANDKTRNIAFYKKVSESTSDITIRHLFKALSDIESHHILVLNRFGIKPKEFRERINQYEFDEDNIAEAFRKKSDSVKFLKEIIPKVNDPYLVELLDTILEIEKEHVRMIEEYM